MTTMLHIDTSVDLDTSHSRRLSAGFVARWRDRHPGATVLRRDLGRVPPPGLDQPFVKAVKAEPIGGDGMARHLGQVSRDLADEFLRADRYVIGMPMHILTVPSVFKAYVERIFHDGLVFEVTEDGPVGLLGGRKFLFCLAKGSDYRPGAPLAAFDMLESYLVKLLTFCGVADGDITFVSLNDTLAPGGPGRAAIETADREIERLAAIW